MTIKNRSQTAVLAAVALAGLLGISACGGGSGLGGAPDNNNNGNNSSAFCGNDVQEPGEACDGDDLGVASCESLGFDGGSLGCDPLCLYNSFNCFTVGACGDGEVDPGEDCDGANLDGQDCVGLGFDGGDLACTGGCRFDAGACAGTGPICGNGVLEFGEQCDDGAANSDVAPDACRTDCSAPACGDDVADSGERCDGVDLGGEDCASLGLSGGTLACGAGCDFDTSGCGSTPTCGDGVVQPPESCDGANLNGFDCLDFSFTGGVLGCANDCTVVVSGCTGPGCSPTGGGVLCGGSVSGDTGTSPAAMDVVDNWTGNGCLNFAETGPEIVYSFNPGAASAGVQVDLTGLTADLDLTVMEDLNGGGCQPDLDCLDNSFAGGQNPESIAFVAAANTNYYIVVDGFNDAVSPFDLVLSCAQPARQIWEWFPLNANDNWDLTGSRITFTPDSGSPQGYTWLANTAVGNYPSPLGTSGSAPTQVVFGAPDDTDLHIFPPGQPFVFFGQTFSSVWINSHGNLTFGQGDTSYDETDTAFTGGAPRIAADWDRLDVTFITGANGVFVEVFGDRTVMTWHQIKDAFTNAVHSAQIELFNSGVITITNIAHDGDDGLVGITEGGGSAGPPEVDFVP